MDLPASKMQILFINVCFLFVQYLLPFIKRVNKGTNMRCTLVLVSRANVSTVKEAMAKDILTILTGENSAPRPMASKALRYRRTPSNDWRDTGNCKAESQDQIESDRENLVVVQHLM